MHSYRPFLHQKPPRVSLPDPNGYTLLMALSSIVVVPEADQVLGRPRMYELAQLEPIARFTADPTMLVVRAESADMTRLVQTIGKVE